MAHSAPPATNSNGTQLKIEKFSCIWTISNFNDLPHKMGQQLISPRFSAGTNSISEWCLQLYPKGSKRNYDDCLSLYLHYIGSESEVYVKCSLGILNTNGEKNYFISFEKSFKRSSSWGSPRFIIRNSLPLDDKELKIFCELNDLKETITKFKLANCTLNNDLRNLLRTAEFSDVMLVVRNQEFRAHKAILAARSSVFAEMFKPKLAEQQKSNRIELTNLEPEILKEILSFIYTEEVPNLNKLSAGLLAAAVTYNLNKLQTICTERLAMGLTIEKAAETLILADMYGLQDLKSSAMDFINSHTVEVKETQGWRNLVTAHNHLILELFMALAEKQDNLK